MELANKVMMAATPSLRAPTSVRAGDEHPEFVHVDTVPMSCSAVVAEPRRNSTPRCGRRQHRRRRADDAMFDAVSNALAAAGIEHGRATRSGLEMGITVVPVSVVKGLELDGVVVVEPADIVAGEQQGLRALYVALTRSTKRLTIVHARPLPAAMS
jgi:hypothetical protein